MATRATVLPITVITKSLPSSLKTEKPHDPCNTKNYSSRYAKTLISSTCGTTRYAWTRSTRQKSNAKSSKCISFTATRFTQSPWSRKFISETVKNLTSCSRWQRSWTLKEVAMSTSILIVGRNTHFWLLEASKQGNIIRENDLLSNAVLGFKYKTRKSTKQILRHTHFRTSSKEHDKIFSQVNIFADLINIDIDYNSDFSPTMNAFYRKLIKRDFSVMFFGSVIGFSGWPLFHTTMGSYNHFPSWIGFSGLHSWSAVIHITLDGNVTYYIDEVMHIHIKFRSYTIRPIRYNNHNVFFDPVLLRRATSNYNREITSMAEFDGDQESAIQWSQ